MGVIIYAGDDRDFKKGDYIVMHGEISTAPTTPQTTFILHCESFPASMAKEWLPVVEYRLVVIPRKAVSHIQNKAAGPPIKIAIATPPIFPVPTVPDKAVLKA